MGYEQAKFWVDIVQTLVSAGLFLWLYLINRHQVNEAQLRALDSKTDKRLDDHGDRITKLETDVKHAPDDEDLRGIHQRIDDVVRAISTLEGEFSGANRTLQLIHEHLLSGGNK